ncbi:MAG: type II toxin-antitoxin system HicA family toxin [Chloroflexia bacterium]
MMTRFPIDAPKARVVHTLELLGFRMVREREHIALVRDNPDGTHTPLTLPNHPRINGATLRTICTRARIRREEFLEAYQRSR